MVKMRPEDIRNHLRHRPFEPIRLFLSDGAKYDIRHPEMMMVTRTEVIIGLDPGDDEIPQRKAYCNPIHITHIEPINGR